MEDPLTGLANLRALERAAHKRFNQKSRGDRGGMTGLLLIDLDNFKSANSQHGHVGGDHALRMIAHQLMRVAPKDAVVARVGGDEFAVLMSAESSARVAETGAIFRGAVRAASSIMEMPGVEIDAAVGMAVYPDDGRDLSELLDKADRVMYEEKGAKRHAFPNLESVPIDPSARPAWLAAERESEVEPKRRHASLDSATGGNLPRFAGLTLYARTSAMAWAFGSVVLGLSLALPSSAQSTLPWWLALFGGLALSAGILRVNAEPQSRTHLLFDSMALLGVAGLIALTGGLQSAAPPLLILLAASQAWFWNTKMVAARTIGPVAVALSPLLYDSLGGGAQTSIELVMLFAESAMIVAVVLSMYFDRVLLSKLQESAHELAMTDPLTGINNRRAFNAFVQDLIDDEHSEQFAIVMIDLDNFKQVNTLRGHRGGDAVLIAIAKSLHASAREDDCIARIGGDEFAAVLPGVGVDGARTLAERFVQTISNTPEASDSHVGASAGFALHPLHGETLDGLVFTADSALMAVKASGKGSARVARVVSAV
jgi:diguanylate cyclase (GGDEF)-like protein